MVTKICKRCNEEKSISEFHKRVRCKDGYAIYCKKCNNAINTKSYHTYWQKRRQYNDAYHYKRIEQLRLIMDSIKVKYGCCFCGYNEYAVALDFHHVDLDTKLHNVASLINRKVKTETLYNEMEKCLIVCSNCHRLIHSKILSCENKTPILLERP